MSAPASVVYGTVVTPTASWVEHGGSEALYTSVSTYKSLIDVVTGYSTSTLDYAPSDAAPLPDPLLKSLASANRAAGIDPGVGVDPGVAGSSAGSLSHGGEVGLVVVGALGGAIAGLAALLAGLVYWRKWRNRRQGREHLKAMSDAEAAGEPQVVETILANNAGANQASMVEAAGAPRVVETVQPAGGATGGTVAQAPAAETVETVQVA
ncbi:hypothetical protein NA57DRAFT_60530 [Rhizodiscina lignyota]|uniref:Uncharacterized protein n=1 Tax=Rhizodiscina lignyota TaxID=1504668 RepID=A0A9P4I8R1_9PEZI|nr:hypothetical protein NA57DRAFT_60530 [Rhizodiscina lignyota]